MDPPGEEVYAQEPLVVSLMKAIGDDNIGLLESLIRTQLACVNAGFPRTVSGDEPLIPGTRPVHFAAARLNVSAVRLLLQMGADPGLPDRGGYTAIHVAADSGHADILDLVLAGRPTGPMLAALTTPASDGQSPLSLAAGRGYSAAVSRLLGAGAKHSVSLMAPCALRSAIRFGHADVVRVLVKNIDAVGGIAKLPLFLTCASLPGRAVILDLLLSAEGKKKRRKWARSSCQGVPLLTYAAGYGILANVNVLLAAGADETIVDTLGRSVTDVIGFCLEGGQKKPVEARAVSRALQRAPAYRALSWRWPRRSGFAAAVAAGSPSQAPRSPLGVAVFRPIKRSKRVMRPVFRYVLKR